MKILYIMSSYNLYGGTPKKTLDLMKYFGEKSVLYVYHNSYSEFKPQFEATGGNIYEGFYGRNIFLHLKKLLHIIDNDKIDVIQTQFTMGETLGYLIKLLRPKVKLIVAFVTPFKPTFLKSLIVPIFYRSVDSFVFITNFVRNEKFKQFPLLKEIKGEIIFNGTQKRKDDGEITIEMKTFSIFDIAGLSKWKNIQVLIEALNILINNYKIKDVFLYVAGEGPHRIHLEALIDKYSLKNHVNLLGYQSNVGRLLESCDIFVHPAYAEGFGIVIPEAMLAERPIIVSNAGALPELIVNESSGLIVDPYNPKEWADAILRLIDNRGFAQKLAKNAKTRAENEFSIGTYSQHYEQLYQSLLGS